MPGSELNIVRISGQLAADVDLRYTPKGRALASFELCVNSPLPAEKTKNKVKNLIPVIAYGTVAEIAKYYLKKDTDLIIEGKLQCRSFTTIDGENKSVLEVVAEKITKA